MLGLALGAAKMIGGAAKAKAGRGARFARNMMGRGKGNGDGGGGSSAIVARPSSSIIPKPDESSAIVKAPKVKRTYVRLGMEGHLINIRDNVTAIDDYLKGTIAAQKKEIEDFQRRIYEEGNREIRDKLRKDSKKGDKVVKAKKGGLIKKFKNGGSVEGKRLTRTVPPKKGPNSQGMRGTGAAIRGTKFKGVF